MQINEIFSDSCRGSLERPAVEGVVLLADGGGVAIGTPRAFGLIVRRVPHDAGVAIASRWVEIPVVDGNGKVSGVMFRATTRSEIGGMLAAHRPKGSDSIMDVAQFVVHDINNLFAVIASGLRLLQCQDDAGHRKVIVGKMEEAITRGTLLSRQLLDKARLRDNSIDRFVDGDCFVSMVATLNQALRPDVAVRTEINPDLWDFNADPEDLYFALLNLCRNSADAMPSGGGITVAARNIEASGSVSREVVEIIVADDGEGMSQEVLSQASNPYFTTKSPGKGSGLGLPQVQRFAEERGGTLDIESKHGAGTRVRLILPRANTAEAPGTIVAGDIAYKPKADGGVFFVVDPPTTPSAE